MENTIIATGLGVILTISIILGIVISYLRLIIRKLDRVRDCMPKAAIISQVYIDDLKAENGRLLGTVWRLKQNIAGIEIDNKMKADRIRELKNELEKLHKKGSGE